MPALKEVLFLISTATTWKVSKYGVFFGQYFPVFSPNTGKYEPEKAPFFDSFYTMCPVLHSDQEKHCSLISVYL